MTMIHTGRLIATTRKKRRLTPQRLARELGWRNLEKGARKILALERAEATDDELLERIVTFLDISPEARAEAERLDAERLLQILATPVEPEMLMRLMPAVYKRVAIPPETRSEESLVALARENARQCKRNVWLQLPNRVTLWLDETGEIYHRSEPGLTAAAAPRSTLGPLF